MVLVLVLLLLLLVVVLLLILLVILVLLVVLVLVMALVLLMVLQAPLCCHHVQVADAQACPLPFAQVAAPPTKVAGRPGHHRFQTL